MMQDVKIDSYQFLVLVILFTIGTSILVIPSDLAADAKQDAWIAAIIGTAIGLLVVWLYCTLAKWFPHLTIVQMNEKVFGKWIGKAISLLFVMMAFIYTASLLYYSGTFLNTHAMPNTPMVAINILMAGTVVMGVRLGLEVIARSAEILILVFFVLFLFLMIFIAPEIKFENIQPVFEVGPIRLLKSSYFYVSVSSINAVVLLMIFPNITNKAKQAKTSFFMGNLVGGIVIILLTFLCVAVIGAEKTARELYPGYELAKKINIGDFIQRIEAIMGTLWIITLFFKLSLYFYASVFGLAQILNLKDYRPLTLPLGMIAIALSLVMYPNIIFQQQWDETTGSSITIVVGLITPILIVIVYAMKKKFKKKSS